MGALEKEEGSLCFSHFRDEWPDFLRLQITEVTTERAASMAWDFGLRGYDAVHLAAAIWQEALAASITFVTLPYARGESVEALESSNAVSGSVGLETS